MRLLSLVLAAGLVCVGGCVICIGKSSFGGDSGKALVITVEDLAADAAEPGRFSGTWSSRGCWDRDLSPSLYARRQNSSYGNTISWDNFSGVSESMLVPGTHPLSFTVTLPAGRLDFTGRGGYCSGSGDVAVIMDARYLSELETLVAGSIDSNDRFQFLFSRLDLDYVRQMTEAAGRKLTFGELQRLSAYQIQPDLYRAMRQADETLTVDQIIKLKNYHVSPEYVQSFRAAGYDFSADELVKAKNYHLQAGDFVAFRAAGYDFSIDEQIKAKNYHVPASFPEALHEIGKQYSLDEMIKLRNYHVDPSFIGEFQEAGYEFDIDELIKAKNYHVNAGEAARLRKAGYNFSLDDLIRLKNYSVSADYMLALADPAYENFSAEELVRFRQRNISAEEITKIRSTRKQPQ